MSPRRETRTHDSFVATVRIPRQCVEPLDLIRGETNRSVACSVLLRQAISRLADPSASAEAEGFVLLQALQDLARDWPGGKTSSGALWARSVGQMPTDARSLRPSVTLTPEGLILAGHAGSGLVTADMDREVLSFSAPDGNRWETPLDLIALAALAPSVAVGLHRLSAGPGKVQLPGEISMERLDPSGEIRLVGGGIEVVIGALVGYRWSAELNSLLAVAMPGRLARREQLEQQVAKLQEVAK